MNADQDLARIGEQERRLALPRFDEEVAWELGNRLREAARLAGVALFIEVRWNQHTLFSCAMPGTTPGNADWARRKRNTTELLSTSSYGVGLKLQRDGHTLEQRMGLPTRDYASHGGSFPLRVAGCAVSGAVTVSGAPQRQDHALVVEVLAAMCGLPLPGLALD